MQKAEKTSRKEPMSTVMVAVALQDHLARNLCLEKPRLLQKHSLSNLCQPQTQSSSIKQKDIHMTKDTVEQEYVLDRKPPSLTLAQRLGLIDSPKQLLTEEEWKLIKIKADRRKDFVQPCVICKEELGAQAHVLLSCTHVFHKICLQSFERHTGKKSCPMCRKVEYQTRVICDGRRYYHQKCATLIQAAWRGYVIRCWYRKLRQSVPPKDPGLRKKFFEEKLQIITDRMMKSLESDVNRFLHEIDHDLESSRNVFRQFEEVTKPIPESQWLEIMQRAMKRDNSDCPICLTKMEVKCTAADEMDKMINTNLSSVSFSSAHYEKRERLTRHKCLPEISTVNASSKAQHQKPSSKSCPLVQDLKKPSDQLKSTLQLSSHKSENAKPIVILSCSHLFHYTCLDALEEFAFKEGQFICPVCRSFYQKKLVI